MDYFEAAIARILEEQGYWAIRRYVRAKVVPVPRPVGPTRAAPARELVAEAAASLWAARRRGKQLLTATRL